jgi:uncharacterized membrane protein
MVQRRRHLAKAVTYRLFGSAATAGIAYVVSGDAAIGASVGVLDSVAKIGLYYLHERVWYRVRWGVRTPAGHEEGAPDASEAPLVPTIARHGRTNRTDLERPAGAHP